jgi:hypothetical protein
MMGHELYQKARFAEACAHFAKALPPTSVAKLERDKVAGQLLTANLGPLQLSLYRREYARALVITGEYSSAASQLQKMRAAAAYLPSPALAGRFESDVLREEVRVFQCTGQLARAVRALSTSIKLLTSAAPTVGEQGAPRPSDLFDRYQLMAMLQVWAGNGANAREAIDRALAAKGPDATALLLRNRGNQARPMSTFVPAVSSTDDAPWLELGGSHEARYPSSGWSQTAAVLTRHFAALRAEAIRTWREGGFVRQPECLHGHAMQKTAGAMQKTAGPRAEANELEREPEWQQLPVVGVDFVAHKSGACDVQATPAGCALVRELGQLAVAASGAARSGGGAAGVAGAAEAGWWGVERVGYSAIAQGCWIRPHWGETNGRLKLHLGLVVPAHVTVDGTNDGEDGERCRPSIRVGDGSFREWKEREVLFFDDSFEHEVLYNCSGVLAMENKKRGEESLPRIVIQVVLSPPSAE